MKKVSYTVMGGLAAAGCLLAGVLCHAQEPPQAGRYQMWMVAKEDKAETLYVLDTATGDILRKPMYNQAEWRFDSTIPSPSTVAQMKAKYEREQAAEIERVTKRAEERKAAKEAACALFRTGTLEEQVKAAGTIKVYRFDDTLSLTIEELINPAAVAEKSYDTTTPRGAQAARKAQEEAVARRALAQQAQASGQQGAIRRPLAPFLSPRAAIQSQTWEVLADIPMEKGEVFVSFLQGSFDEFIFASDRLKLPEAGDGPVFLLPSKREPAELVEDIKAILAKEEK